LTTSENALLSSYGQKCDSRRPSFYALINNFKSFSPDCPKTRLNGRPIRWQDLPPYFERVFHPLPLRWERAALSPACAAPELGHLAAGAAVPKIKDRLGHRPAGRGGNHEGSGNAVGPGRSTGLGMSRMSSTVAVRGARDVARVWLHSRGGVDAVDRAAPSETNCPRPGAVPR
jgi:hypothetical protein